MRASGPFSSSTSACLIVLRVIAFNSTQTPRQSRSSEQSRRRRDGRRREEAPDDAEPLRRSIRGGGWRSWFRARIQSSPDTVSLGMIISPSLVVPSPCRCLFSSFSSMWARMIDRLILRGVARYRKKGTLGTLGIAVKATINCCWSLFANFIVCVLLPRPFSSFYFPFDLSCDVSLCSMWSHGVSHGWGLGNCRSCLSEPLSYILTRIICVFVK